MLPIRALRWSGQSIGIGRRRLELYSIRSFSSPTVQNGSTRSISHHRQIRTAISGICGRPQLPRSALLLQHGALIRFKSTTPFSTSGTASTPNSISSSSLENPIEPASYLSPHPNSTLDDAIDLFSPESTNLLDVPETLGYLKQLGLDYGWGPTSCIEWILEHVHVLCGTPWWASIVLTAVIIRVSMFWPYISAADNAARLATVSHLTKPLTAKMQALAAANDTAGTMEVRRELKLIHQRAGIVIWKTFTPLLQMFAGYGTFVLLRGMARLPVPGMQTGGALWFPNLTLPDPYFLLPIVTAGILHWLLRKGGETGVTTMTRSTVRILSYALPGITLVFTWFLPAGLQLSFFVSGILSFIQSTLFRSPAVRESLKMMPLPKTPDPFAPSPPEASPYQQRVIVAPKYEPPSSENRDKNLTILGGFTEEVKSTIDSVQKSGKSAMTSLKDMAGTKEGKGGKRSKAELRAAERYEEKRRTEEIERQTAMDERRRVERSEKRARKDGRL